MYAGMIRACSILAVREEKSQNTRGDHGRNSCIKQETILHISLINHKYEREAATGQFGPVLGEDWEATYWRHSTHYVVCQTADDRPGKISALGDKRLREEICLPREPLSPIKLKTYPRTWTNNSPPASFFCPFFLCLPHLFHPPKASHGDLGCVNLVNIMLNVL